MNTLHEIQEGLELLGYDARIEGQSVAFEICRFLAVMTIQEDSLYITCEVALGSEVGDEALTFMLDLNTIINPFAFAISSAKTDGVTDDRVVLIDSVSLLSFTQEELEQATDQLRNAIYVSGPMLRQKMNYSKDRAELYFDSNDLWGEMDLLDVALLVEIIGLDEVDTDSLESEFEETERFGSREPDVAISESEAIPNRVLEPVSVAADDDSTRRSSESYSFGGGSDSDSGSSYDSGGSDSGGDCGGGCD